MSTYFGCSKTNLFQVTDEEAYAKLFAALSGGDDRLTDLSREIDGKTFHGFGSYDSIDYYDEGTGEYDMDTFFKELQKILPDGQVFVLEEIGHEKLRYLDACVTAVSNKSICYKCLEDVVGEAIIACESEEKN